MECINPIRMILTLNIGLFLLICNYFVTCGGYLSGFYADNGLDQTVLVAKLPNKQKREMQQEILNLLGLHHRPRPQSHPSVKSAPKFMMDLYQSLKKDPDDQRESELNHVDMHVNITANAAHHIDHADMIMSFINKAHHVPHMRRDHDRRFYFDFTEVPVTEMVRGAELRIYKKKSHKWFGHEAFNVKLFQVKPGQDLEDRLLEPVANKTIHVSQDGWLEFDITEAAQHWNIYRTSNMGLFMRVLDMDGIEVSPSTVGIVDHTGPEDLQAFMVACFNSDQSLKSRSKRAARGNRKSNHAVTYVEDRSWSHFLKKDRIGTRSCQRKNLHVSFRELGWQDWIIAPEEYGAFYCYGTCSFPLNAHMNATNHAIIQSLVHLMNPFNVPKPCCAPTKLSTISVLFFDDNNNVVLRKYENMVVRACGCH